MKVAIFCEDRFKNNEQFNSEKNKKLEPYNNIKKILWEKEILTYDKIESRKDKDDFLVITWLPLTIFTVHKYINLLIKFRKNKIYLFLKEPPVVTKLWYSKLIHIFFNRVYTWDDSLVDNKKYFKMLLQQSSEWIETEEILFNDKKFLMLINWNKFSPWKNELYSEREKAIRFFENTTPNDFDLYWTYWDKPNLKQKIFWFKKYPSYKWKVENKFTTLSKYKFNICFENMGKTSWYITEKIWDSFKAKSVPIYLWADNINKYIPKNCFIDMRDFSSYNELLKFLENMKEEDYNIYLSNINKFLKTEEAEKNFWMVWANNFIKSLK